MRTVIYLDVLLLTNGWIGGILLAACGVLCGQPCGLLRLVLAGTAAALSSLMILLPPLPFGVQLLYQLCSAACIVWIAFPWKGWRAFLRQGIWYALMNLVLAGVVSAACMQGTQWMETNNLSCYFQLSPLMLLGSSLGVYIILCVIRVQLGGLRSFQTLHLQGADCQLTLSGYCDTGLTVVDPLSGKPVVLVYYPQVCRLLPLSLRQNLEQLFAGKTPVAEDFRFSLLPCDTIGGTVLLPAIPMRLTTRQGEKAVVAAFSQQTPSDQRCDALYGPELAQLLPSEKIPKQKSIMEVRHETTG